MAAKKVNQVVPKASVLSSKSKRKKPGHGDGSLLSDKIKKVVKENK